MDLSGILTAGIAAAGGIAAGGFAGTLAARRAARTAARLIYAELVRNTAPIRYWRRTGQWAPLTVTDKAWQAQSEALARKRGADAFTAVFTGYSALEGLAFVTARTSTVEPTVDVVEGAVTDVTGALEMAGGLAGIDPAVLRTLLGRMTGAQAAPAPAASATPVPGGMVPAYLLDGIIDKGSVSQRKAAEATIATVGAGAQAAAPPRPRRLVRDARNGDDAAKAVVARMEGEPPTGDGAVDAVYDAFGATWAFLWEVFGRDSTDGAGRELQGVVHFGTRFNNSFWDGSQLVVGDGDGELFNRFTSLDLVAHELSHEFIPLRFEGESGALSEAIADVFGSMVKQHSKGQTVEEADWLLGADLLGPAVKGVALRSLEAPGSAYDDDVLGKDAQPAHMDGYVRTKEDNGGVHVNAGIPAHAFYLAATAAGGYAWDGAGRVWWDALFDPALPKRATFAGFAGLTVAAAERLAAGGPDLVAAVKDGWAAVGVTPA
jgi:hypothetical protein